MSDFRSTLTNQQIENILTHAVLFCTQSLTEAQKELARQNIGAGTGSEITQYVKRAFIVGSKLRIVNQDGVAIEFQGNGEKGDPGEDGNGIESIEFNDDYSLTFTFTNGETFTTGSLRGARGEQGIQGIQGEPGTGLKILGFRATVSALPSSAAQGDMYGVGSAAPYTIYMWDDNSSPHWVSIGQLQGQKGDQGEAGNGIASVRFNTDYTLTLTFTNGDTFTTGSLRGAQGSPGTNGTNGTNATINGQTALTLNAGDGLSASMSGSTMTLSLDLDNYDGGTF